MNVIVLSCCCAAATAARVELASGECTHWEAVRASSYASAAHCGEAVGSSGKQSEENNQETVDE